MMDSATLKTEAAGSSGKLILTYQAKRLHTPENHSLDTHLRENLK
jgi:hypothetical protein